jgi:hypothetical protein
MPEVSRTLKSKYHRPGSRHRVEENKETGVLLSAIARVAHPALYITGHSAFAAMQDLPEITKILPIWSSVFNGVSIICNRDTPPHRDTGTLDRWFDILATIGGDYNTVLKLNSIGLDLAYRSGTVVLFSGAALIHSVAASEANRVCFAYFMKNRIHEKFGIRAPNWMELSIYSNDL